MTFPEWLMFGVVAALAAFAGWRNATALGLALVYFIILGAWEGWGVSFPTPTLLLFDATVIAFMYAKSPAFDCLPYRSLGDQFCALWFERSYWDRLVLALFGVAWFGYFAPLTDSHRWLVLYWAAIAQYVAAGGETLQASLRSRSAKAGSVEPEGPIPPGATFAGVGVRGYG